MHLTAPSDWPRSIGTGGRDPSERVVTIAGMRTALVVKDSQVIFGQEAGDNWIKVPTDFRCR